MASSIKPKIILHIADPAHASWWFDSMTLAGRVTDFDCIGLSYYPIWHTAVPIAQLAQKIAFTKNRSAKAVMLVETAYPFTEAEADHYQNLFGPGTALPGYPATPQGQALAVQAIAQAAITGGAMGVVYWAPDWISVPTFHDLWGNGSSWENIALVQFDGNAQAALRFARFPYNW